MQKKKMSLDNIQNKISRAEMKNIMAGSGVFGTPGCGESCASNSDCSLNSSCPSCLAGKGPTGGCGCG